MRTIVHLSDLHFGRLDNALVDPLGEIVRAMRPNLVVVSGDLTQRARTSQFQAAAAFLNTLLVPWLAVPGNHDVPLHNLFARFFRPLANYRQYIHDTPAPFYCDDEIVVLGVDTTRSLTIKDGRINEKQIAGIRERLVAAGDGITKILVSHHPFYIPRGADKPVGRARRALTALAHCQIDVLLAGHLHLSHLGHTAAPHGTAGYSALVLSAGTATSTRVRGERNSFNVLHIDYPYISVRQFAWNPATKTFVAPEARSFRRTTTGWMPTDPEHCLDKAGQRNT